MVAVHHLSGILWLAACSAPELGAVEMPSQGTAQPAVEVLTVGSASAAPLASAAPSASTLEPEPKPSSTPIAKGPCSLPAKRPASFGVKVLQHVIRMAEPTSGSAASSPPPRTCARATRARL